MPRLVPYVASIAFVASAAPLNAQQSDAAVEIRAGSRVRLEAPGIVGGRMVGTVISRTSDTLTVASPSTPSIAVPIARITRLEVSRGDSHAAGALHGLKWGIPIGVGLGALVPLLSNDCKTCKNQPSAGGAFAVLAVNGAVWGAVVGALVQHEQWAPSPLTPRVSFDPLMQRGTLALSARF